MIGDAALARRLESFQADVAAELAKESLTVGEGKAVFGGIGSPVTQAIGVDGDVDRVESFFFERGSASIIQVTPWSSPEFLDQLTSRGYKFHEFENVFARQIDVVTQPANADIRIADDIDAWARVGAEGFATPEMSVDFLMEIFKPFATARHARCYLAYVDGEPAGSATMIVSPEKRVVGLFGASTRPQFRRRGIQAAFLQRRLADAANEGCDIAMITTLPGSDSHRNVARRGFELLYTKISMRLDIAARRA